MQDSTSWRGWGRGQKSLVGWVCAAAAYCRNVNPPNVLQLEEEQDNRLNWAFRARGGGQERGGREGGRRGGRKSGSRKRSEEK